MWKYRATLLLLAAGCHPTPVPATSSETLPPHWCLPPVIAASDGFSEKCRENLAVAIEFWRGVGVRFGDIGLLPAKDVRPGVPLDGMVQMFPAELPPSMLRRTAIARTSPECIAAAEIELAGCDVSTLAHELGHALGLRHVDDPENLMFLEDRGHLGLTQAQRAAVTQ